MVQEIVTWCSNHLLAHDERVAAKRTTISFDGKSAKLIDLCDDCMKQYVVPLRELLDSYGDKTEMPKAKPAAAASSTPAAAFAPRARGATSSTPDDRVMCLVCGSNVMRSAESSHYTKRHETSKGRWLIDHGQPEGVVECPVARCDFAAMSTSGIGAHVARSSEAAHRSYARQHFGH